MKEKLIIAQLRSTIFLPQNIGYTPEVAENFKELLLPDSKAYSVAQFIMPMPGVNPNIPQFGMPWRLFKKFDDKSYNISFLPGKIDIVLELEKETQYGGETEKDFCEESAKLFNEILKKQGDVRVTRIAYAPLYAISVDNDNTGKDTVWGGLIKKLSYDGLQMRDINLSFLLKDIIVINDSQFQMNFLYNIFDGVQIKTENNTQKIHNVIFFQFDLNSVPEKHLSLDAGEVKVFYDGILNVKNNLVNNVI